MLIEAFVEPSLVSVPSSASIRLVSPLVEVLEEAVDEADVADVACVLDACWV